MNFIQFNEKFYNTQEIIQHFIKIRYPDGIKCPYCGSLKVYQKFSTPKKFICNDCNNDFSIFKGTIFEKSSTDLKVWFFAIFQVLNAKKGISAKQLQRDTGVTYKTAWRILKQIRAAMGNEKDAQLFETIVEIDETYVGGKPQNDKKMRSNPELRKQIKKGRGTKKTPIVGIKERDGNRVFAQVALPNQQGKKLSGKQLLELLDKVVKSNSIVVTDDFRSYGILDRQINKDNMGDYHHFVVNHSLKQYSAGDGVHTNGIESFWALLKRGVYGTYHHISVKLLQDYVNEFCFRQNNRNNDLVFDDLLARCVLVVK